MRDHSTIYDHPDGRQPHPISSSPLAAYLALLHVCGHEAKLCDESMPVLTTDVFTLWNTAGPGLKAGLKRDAGHVVCPELRTRFPAAAWVATMPIALGADELDAVLAAAKPLQVADRDEFLCAVAHELEQSRGGDVGPGTFTAPSARVQRRYFAPPKVA
jgi:hypothetical protein